MKDLRKNFLAILGEFIPPDRERVGVALASYRYENKLDLWTGLPLTESDTEVIMVADNE